MVVGKWRKKPVVIDAFQWVPDDVNLFQFPEWFVGQVSNLGFLKVLTLEGAMTGNPGDWVIRGIAGEVYFCKPEIFEASYERVEHVE